ncbi:MAG: hypothetical protein RIR51_2152 [Bacteroidota bacterium]
MKLKFKILSLFSILFINLSCTEEFEQIYNTTKKIIIVEGMVTNSDNLGPIILKESLTERAAGSNFRPILGATVQVIINGSESITLTEGEEGRYYFDPSFKGEIGSSYQLKFSTPNGREYESSEDVLEEAIPIDNVTHILDKSGIKTGDGQVSAAYLFYADFQDPENNQDYYFWQWKLYEQQPICRTCLGGYWYIDPAPLGTCVEDRWLARAGIYLDYQCSGNCWEIINSEDLEANSDEFFNGNAVKNQYIGKVPIYQHTTALLELDQYAVTKEVYDFINLSQKQSIISGGLADTPPAALVGNIHCISDPTVNTSGLFIVAAHSTYKYWLDKQDVLKDNTPTVGLLGGRKIRLEPQSMATDRPPLAPCLEGPTRTSIMPEGWMGN